MKELVKEDVNVSSEDFSLLRLSKESLQCVCLYENLILNVYNRFEEIVSMFLRIINQLKVHWLMLKRLT